MPVEIVGTCPHCAKVAAQELLNLPSVDAATIQEVMGVAGGVAGTIALIIQTSNDLHDLYTKLTGEKDTDDIQEECEAAGGDVSEEEIQEALNTIRQADLENFQCRCKDCSNQSKLTEFA